MTLFLLVFIFSVSGLGAQEPAAEPLAVDETTMVISDTPLPASEVTGPQAPSSELGIWDFLRMILVLGVVVGLVYVFVLFLRKISGQPGRVDGLIKVHQTQILQGTRALHLVEVAGEFLIIGTGDTVNLIKEIHDQEAIDQIRLAASREVPGSRNFFSMIQGFLGKPAQKAEFEPVEPDTSSDFLKKQRDRLKNL